MKHWLLGSLAGGALALSLTAAAHHSAAVLYLLDQQITVEGTVTRFTLGNPHARIFLTVTGADGTTAEWMAEGGSRTILLRKGWTGEEVKAGDAIRIIGNPSRDGSNVVHWQRLVLPNGQELWGEDIPEESVLEELRQRRR
jgi:hypothetical protein